MDSNRVHTTTKWYTATHNDLGRNGKIEEANGGADKNDHRKDENRIRYRVKEMCREVSTIVS